jgi:hypothetical protein
MSDTNLAAAALASLATNPFMALEAHKPAVAERIATAFCYADDVHTLSRCLSYGDRLAGRIEYFAVLTATVNWLDGEVFAAYGYREGLESKEIFDAVQGMAWDYLDALDKRTVAAWKVG